jgi:Trk K+ transport system NAD-binding subunit
LKKWTTLDAHDYTSLLKLSGEYMVTEIQVREGEWLVGRTLREFRLPEEGMIVLGIYRVDGDYVGIPRGETEIFSKYHRRHRLAPGKSKRPIRPQDP